MDEKIDKAIEDLLAQAFRPGSVSKPDDAMKYSQAALNLAHAKERLASAKRPKDKGAGA